VPDVNPVPNVLAVRFSSIGDVLLITPLLRAIRRKYPAARVTVLTKQVHAPLLSHNPHLNRVISLDPGQSIRELARELRAQRYSHLLDLHGSLRSRLLQALVPGNWATYPKHRLARALLIQTKRDWYQNGRPVAERYFAAARDLQVAPDGGPPDFFVEPDAVRETTAWLEGNGLGQGQPLITVAPGAAHATKRWPLSHWKALVRRFTGDGFHVIIVGGPDDTQLGAELLAESSGTIASAAGRFGLQGTGALLQRSAALISGDTGVMHMATAVGTPVVALFGPTVKAFGFFPYTPNATVLELDLSCRPCSSKGTPRCPLGHHRCLVDIRPETVLEAVREYLP
jgi:heptosyltransferase-2